MPCTVTGICVTECAGRFPAVPSARQVTGTSPVPSMATVSAAANCTPPALSNSVPCSIVPVPLTVSTPPAKVAALRAMPLRG